MKKYLKTLLILLCTMTFIGYANAASGSTKETFWLPKYNGYYQSSEHRYSYVDDNQELHAEISPSIYTLLLDENKAQEGEWNFSNYYNVPWTAQELNYLLVYYADINTNIVPGEKYQRISLNDYDKLSDEAKLSLVGIIKNSYPFISFDEMIKKLVSAGVLVQKTVNLKTVYTAKENENLETDIKSITSDELVSAIQTAIYYYTNPDNIKDIYEKTINVTTDSVLLQNSLWQNEYESGTYDEVKNNIMAVYNYLITLKDNISTPEISKIDLEENDKKSFTLHIKLNDVVSEKDDLKILVYEDLLKRGELNLKDAKISNDGYYEIKVNTQYDEKKIRVKLSGNTYSDSNVDIYNNGASNLIGLSAGSRPLDKTFAGKMGTYVNDKNNKNPNTADYILIFSAIAILSLGVVAFTKKKSF